MFAIIIKSLIDLNSGDIEVVMKRAEVSNFNYLLPFIGVASYSIEGVGLILPLRKDFIKKNPSHKFKTYYFCAFAFIVFLYLIFGTVNYMNFGLSTQSIIFYNFTSKTLVIFVLENLYALVFLLVAVFIKYDEHVYCL